MSIIINEFQLSDDLGSISLDIASDFAYDYVRIYVGDAYLTSVYYDVPIVTTIDGNGRISLVATIVASQLGEEAPLTDIYILSMMDEHNEITEAGIWSLEAPSQCLANQVLNYPNPCNDCKGITSINITFMNIEATVSFLSLGSFEKALTTLAVIEKMCTDYGVFTVPTAEACSGIGCWIIENDFIVT